MQNFASPASKFCHLIAGQKLVKTHFADSRGNIEPVHGPDARPLLEVKAPHEPGNASRPGCGFERRLAARKAHEAGRPVNSQARTPALPL